MQYIQIHTYTYNTSNTFNTCYTCRYIQIHTHADDTCAYIHHAFNMHAIYTDTYTYIHLTASLYVCMYVYVLHVCNVIHTDTYPYMYIHANTYTYIHIHTPHNQCHEGVFGCCCFHTRLLCAAPPTQICSDGAQDGISTQALRVEGAWAAQGSCFPPPLRVQGARARQNGSGHGSLITG